MQLFLLDHIDLKWNDIMIDNPELWQQAKKVLRLQSGDQIFVQIKDTRYEVIISELRDLKIFGKVKNTQQAPLNEQKITMIIAMPNKWEKAELIVQKLTEIGVSEIIFRPSERSVVKVWNENKATRLEKIMKEALEQSRGRHLPKISFCLNIENYLKDASVILFDKTVTSYEWGVTSPNKTRDRVTSHPTHVTGFVWPEGGRWPKDYELFKKYDTEVKDLWATVLRMETAAIVGAWFLKNLL